MEHINALVADKDSQARVELVNAIRSQFSDEVKVLEVSDQSQILSTAILYRPGIIFLDILWGEEPMFPILDKLKETGSHLAFVSDHTEYALEGYKYNPVGFMTKPVEEIKLSEVMKRLEALLAMQKGADPRRMNRRTDSKITVADSKGLHVFHVNDIMYCLGERNYTTFKLHDGESIVVSKTLKYFDDKLSDTNFFRAHKSNLINLNYVKMVTKEDGGVIRMYDQKELPVSRAKKKELYRRLEGFG